MSVSAPARNRPTNSRGRAGAQSMLPNKMLRFRGAPYESVMG